MPQKRHTVDQVVAKLRKADVELGKGKKVPKICKLLVECSPKTDPWVMKVYQPKLAKGFSMKKRKRHSPEQVVKKLRDADAMLAAGKSIGEVLQMLEVSEATLSRWRSQYGGMKSEEAKRLKMLEEENNRLKKIVGDQALDIQMLKEITKGN